MTLATGIFKKLVYGAESTWGAASSASGQYLRRVQSTLAMTRDPFQSNEIRSTQQVADFRLGMRRVSGQITGEVSGGTYSAFWANLFRKDLTAGVSLTATDISATAGTPGKFSSAAGAFITTGFKVGDVVRFSGFTTPADVNNARNYRITTLTAHDMTVGSAATGAVGALEAVVTAAAGDSVTVAVTGKKVWVPQSGHTNSSMTIEHFHSDINQSELFTGCKVSQASIQLPPTGMATCNFGIMGKDMSADAAAHFASPTAASTGSVYAAVNGVLRVGGTDVGIVTGASINVNGNLSAEPVIGSNFPPGVFPGKINCSGQFTAFFQDGVFRDWFINEVEVDLYLMMTQNSLPNASFMTINLPRIKLGGAAKNDSDKGLIQTIPFTALENVAGGTGTASDATTISIQDSQA